MSADKWYGLNPQGEQIMMLAEDVEQWAESLDISSIIDTSKSIEMPDGSRIVRGDNPVAYARAAQWDDLAEQLQAVFEHNPED